MCSYTSVVVLRKCRAIADLACLDPQRARASSSSCFAQAQPSRSRSCASSQKAEDEKDDSRQGRACSQVSRHPSAQRRLARPARRSSYPSSIGRREGTCSQEAAGGAQRRNCRQAYKPQAQDRVEFGRVREGDRARGKPRDVEEEVRSSTLSSLASCLGARTSLLPSLQRAHGEARGGRGVAGCGGSSRSEVDSSS